MMGTILLQQSCSQMLYTSVQDRFASVELPPQTDTLECSSTCAHSASTLTRNGSFFDDGCYGRWRTPSWQFPQLPPSLGGSLAVRGRGPCARCSLQTLFSAPQVPPHSHMKTLSTPQLERQCS
ncbi:hypothetical protein DUNSADRAFT_18106 [Dunaliella salina]|uniref:Encoded protein n=1 Tax=Dunaliella salina TaxID=3046 RepID=A0ABQ7G0N1_DUNSA|nr:hypothetical protein DUNSADRAFT_18106 [Dunaliella salina]|eukprot:KAF5828166.1 hypothetical protein DUNSADRAFT_18106 [Dunaliella salina]